MSNRTDSPKDRRLFIKGSNYIGSPWLSTMTRKKYLRDFRLVTAMNANAIRVHGHVAGRALYEVADEMGLMIWQDVPLQWGYDDSAAFAENALHYEASVTFINGMLTTMQRAIQNQ